jgi:hypothetical protein
LYFQEIVIAFFFFALVFSRFCIDHCWVSFLFLP